jgi:anthranilate phosphoribosyltransferase
MSFTDLLENVSRSENLTSEEAAFAMHSIAHGLVSGEEIAAFLIAIRMKGETLTELTAFIRVLREASIPVEVDVTRAVDLCGTGGDKSGTFNISTASMFVVAGAGVSVLKHGNRSVSSKSGSSDVLEVLGVKMDLKKEQVEKVFNDTGMAFMFAPNFHPAMKHVVPVRRALKMRTFFNIVGPLLNPSKVENQVVGAFNRDTAKTMASILGEMNTRRAFAVHAQDGLDEVSLSSKTEIFEVNGSISSDSYLFDPAELGIKKTDLRHLLGGDSAVNAEIIKNILTGKSTDAQRNVVLLNSAFAIHVSGAAATLEQGLEMAGNSINSGSAAKKLTELAKASKGV